MTDGIDATSAVYPAPVASSTTDEAPLRGQEIRPLVSCVGENQDAYLRRIELLVKSLRAFGGSLSQAPFVAHLIGGARPEFVDRLRVLDAEVRIVEPYDRRNVLANKLRMLELASSRDFDVLVALDCDVVVVGDVGPWLSTHAFGAKSADFDYASDGDWRRLLERLGIPKPERAAVATSTGRRMIPYFNSGVMFIPADGCMRLLEGWTAALEELHRLVENDRHVIPIPSLTEQVALTCAIHRGGHHYTLLPVGLNFPTHAPVHRRVRPDQGDIRVLHYHADIDDRGLLYRGTCRAADSVIERFNRWRAADLGIRYDGLHRRPWRTTTSRLVNREVLLLSLRRRRVLRWVRGSSFEA